MPDQLFLCFNGDGPYWSDFVRTISYPSGFSYTVYPFRYDTDLVEPSLAAELGSADGIRQIVNTEAVLGARFGKSHQQFICPIRKVTVTHLEISAGVYSFYFRCGPLLDVRSAHALSDVAISIPPADRARLASYICFRAPLTPPAFVANDPAAEEQVWANFCELIVREPVLPIKDEARQSLFLRFRTPASGKQAASVSCLETSEGRGPTYGAVFLEGKHYELTYAHRVPFLEGKNTTIAEIPFDYKPPTTSVELSSPTGTVIGNYQVSHLSLSAIRASSSWEEVLIQPHEKVLTAQNSDKINAFDIKIPFKVEWSFWYRFRTTWLFVLLLWLALTVVGSIAAFADIVKDISAGKAIDWALYKYYIPVSALASAFAALAVFLLQAKVKNRVK
jgi:hypothetical protein